MGKDYAEELRVAAKEVRRHGLRAAVVVMLGAADELERQRVELDLGYGRGAASGMPVDYLRAGWSKVRGLVVARWRAEEKGE